MAITKIDVGTIMDVINGMINAKEFAGVETGYIGLDHMLGGGLEKGKVYLMAGRPAMGKTALAINIAFNSIRAGYKVVYASGELSIEDLIERMIKTCALLQNNAGEYTEEEMIRMIDAAKYIGKKSLVIDDTELSCENIYKDSSGLYKDADLIIIDYLQLMKLSCNMGEIHDASSVRNQEQICENLRTYAKENNVAILLLSQIGRSCEARTDHRPRLSDLKYPIDRYADVVMFLYRDGYYDPESETRDVAEVNIVKNNNGMTSCVKLMWLQEYLKFLTWERR